MTNLVISLKSVYSNNPDNPQKHIIQVGDDDPNSMHSIFEFDTQKDLISAYNLASYLHVYFGDLLL